MVVLIRVNIDLIILSDNKNIIQGESIIEEKSNGKEQNKTLFLEE